MTDIASRDANRVTTLLGVSSADGVAPVKIYADPTTHRMLVQNAITSGRVTAQTGAASSIVTVTAGATDESYLVWGNINCTVFSSGTFSLQCNYTNESNVAQTPLFEGHFTSGYGTTVTGTGSFEGQPLALRVKAGTTITILTSGTFTSLTYNAEGFIQRTA